MEQKNAREIQQALALPFAPEDLEWRLQTAIEDKLRGLAVPYVTNRAIQTRLDDVVGPDNWYNDYKPWHGAGKKEAQLCGIAIYFEGKGFITKWDGAEDSDVEPVKGGLSDSMKRAAVQWGIGRVLYSMDMVWVDIEKRGRSFVIKDSERPKLDEAYIRMLQRLGLKPAPAGGLQSLLTPKNTAEAPRAGEQPKNADHSARTPAQTLPVSAGRSSAAQKPQTPAAPKAPPAPAAEPPQSIYEYVVLAAKVQGGMKSSSTQVMLESADGKRIQAFARGARPELAAGVCLTAVKLTLQRQDTVVYYILESYKLVEPQGKAA